VSADYRLAPQVGVSHILEDVLDCIHYVRNDLSRESAVEPETLDTSRLAIVGSSAGGYLALLAGLYAVPKPKVVLAIYPNTNPQGEFFLNPHSHPLGHIDRAEVAESLDKDAEAVSEDTHCSEGRRKLYFWMLQTASYADLVRVGANDQELIVTSQIRKMGKAALPATYIVHGDSDVLVDVGQSDEVADAMRDVGVINQYERLEGLDHLFDREDSVSMANMYAFMKRYS
jgi:acetyl esterase/lipase